MRQILKAPIKMALYFIIPLTKSNLSMLKSVFLTSKLFQSIFEHKTKSFLIYGQTYFDAGEKCHKYKNADKERCGFTNK